MTPEIFLDMLVSDLTVLLSQDERPRSTSTIFLFHRWTMRMRTQMPRT